MLEYRERGFPFTTVRPSLTYDTVIPLAIGSWNDFTMIDRMRKGMPVVVQGEGTSLWTVTHSDDFAKGFVPLLGNAQAIGHAFHITSDELLTWDQIWQATAATIPYRVGIARTIRWFEADPKRMRIVDGNNAIHDEVLKAWGG